jgi:hypothetical protein
VAFPIRVTLRVKRSDKHQAVEADLQHQGQSQIRSAKHWLALLQESREGFFGVGPLQQLGEVLHLAVHGSRDSALQIRLH